MNKGSVKASRPRRPGMPKTWLTTALLWTLVFYGITPTLFAQSGNISPGAVEIDINANLYSGDGNANILNPGAALDWVKDNAINSDPASVTDGVATGIIPNVTGAANGKGHWNGLRIVDGIAGNDNDIFLTGGKENDTSTWNVGPGSVGSAKYDATQAYIANNQSEIFFGMERRGNNGTTAFDFEFNQSGAAGGYVPVRSPGDVLLTFEMQGSGGSGSATPHYFIWSGSTYAEQAPPAGVISSINNSVVPSGPWGFVTDKGNWAVGDIGRFQFAEARVPLSILPGVNSCGGAAFVQVRTRSSSTPTSDLKDTTQIFRYVFGGPSAAGSLTPSCTFDITYDGSGSRNSSNGTSNLSYSWQFMKLNVISGQYEPAGTATGVSGTFSAGSAGRYKALLTVTEGGGTGCQDARETTPIEVDEILGATASKTGAATPNSGFADSGFVATVTGNTNGTGLQWQQKSGNNYSPMSGQTNLNLGLSLADIFTLGGTPTSGTASLLGDPYSYLTASVTVRLHVTRGQCSADSNDVTVKALKAVDP